MIKRISNDKHGKETVQITGAKQRMSPNPLRLYDISRNITNGMSVWPGDTPVKVKTINYEGKYRITSINLSAHNGTHIDAPAHFINGGSGVDAVDLDILIGSACVFQLPDLDYIDCHHLEKLPLNGETRLLLGTADSGPLKTDVFNKDYAFLTDDAAYYLIERGIRLLALDSPSVDCFDTQTYPVHRILLEAEVVIVEGVDLRGVPQGKYELLCLPLKIDGADGAPARIALREL